MDYMHCVLLGITPMPVQGNYDMLAIEQLLLAIKWILLRVSMFSKIKHSKCHYCFLFGSFYGTLFTRT